jgi:outer membrane protein
VVEKNGSKKHFQEGGNVMKKKESKWGCIGFLRVVVGIATVCFFSTVALATEEESQAYKFDPNQTVLAGVTPDYQGVDTADTEIVGKKDPAWSLGAGIGIVPDYEGSEDLQGVPLLFVRAGWNSGRYVQFLASTLKANVIASDTWSFGPLARYRGKRDDDVDNDKVKLMRQVDEAIEIGAFVGYKTGNWHASLQAANDVNDAHDGLVVTLEGGYTMPLDKGVKLGMSLFTTYANDDYMQTYFSVDADNANRSGLARMKDVGGMLNLAYAPWENWGITGILGLKRLVGDAKDSPLVDQEGSESQFFGGVMATYRF